MSKVTKPTPAKGGPAPPKPGLMRSHKVMAGIKKPAKVKKVK